MSDELAMKLFAIRIPDALRHKVKVAAAVRKMSLQEFVTHVLNTHPDVEHLMVVERKKEKIR